MTLEDRVMNAFRAMDERHHDSIVTALESMAKDFPRKSLPRLALVSARLVRDLPREAANKG